MAIASGKKGQTLSSLRPYGRIEIEGTAYEAKAESGWLDEGVDVVVIRSGSFGIVVRRQEHVTDGQTDSAECSVAPRESEKESGAVQAGRIPLHGPVFWLDRVNAPLLGGAIWTVVGGLLLFTGLPLSLELLLLPLGGALSGAIFRYFVHGTRKLEAAYSDHRPKAYFFAFWMLSGATFAVVAACSSGGGFAVMSGALILGTLGGAFLALAIQFI